MQSKLETVLFSLLLVTACGGDEATPSGSDGTADAGGPDDDGGSGDDGGSIGDDSGTTGGGPGDDGGSDDTGGEGCIEDPVEPEDFLDACTDATCEPFDNAARLPLLGADGSLPPIP